MHPRHLLPLATPVVHAWAAWQARRIARNFPLATDDEYFHRLRRAHSGDAPRVHVLPYSYHLPPASQPGLDAVLDQVARHQRYRCRIGTAGEPDRDLGVRHVGYFVPTPRRAQRQGR